MMQLDSKNYVKKAENVMLELKKKGKGRISLTASKIRNLHSMISDLYNEVLHDKSKELSDETQGKIQYLKMRFAYEAGSEPSVKDFVKEANVFKHIDQIGNDKEKFLLFCRYMEALVAYHKFYGERY